MKKGFTLVELLATIVILAVVSLITMPIITGVINKTRLNSLKSSAYGLLEASNLYVAQYNPDNTIRFDIDNNKVISNDTNTMIKYKGSIKEGTVILNNKGKVTVCITDGKNSAYKNYNENKITLVEKNKCYIPDNTSIVYLDNGATLTELSNQELTDKITELVDKVNKLQSEVETLKEENSNLKTELQSTNSSISEVNTNLSSQISSVNSSLTNKTNTLTTQLQSTNNTISTLNTTLNSVKGKTDKISFTGVSSVGFGTTGSSIYVDYTISNDWYRSEWYYAGTQALWKNNASLSTR